MTRAHEDDIDTRDSHVPEDLPQRVVQAWRVTRQRLLDERVAGGHWIGRLSSSALSTATAISALSFYRRSRAVQPGVSRAIDRQIDSGLNWLAGQQNADGGWGDTRQSYSNISTSMLVRAAFYAAGRDGEHRAMLERAVPYIEQAGGVEGVRRRYGDDKTFAVPILANAAMAGLVPWREVAALPFEAACIPQRFFHWLRLPVVSYAIPALVAIGQVKFHFDPPRNPLLRAIRQRAIGRSLNLLRRMQPASGGFLEAVPLTSFVCMALVQSGRAADSVVSAGVDFILNSFRDETDPSAGACGSWPIDTNLALWTTNLSVLALSQWDFDSIDWTGSEWAECLDWVLASQFSEVHPFTGSPPGGWGWTDLPGAVPDADDTPAALLALGRIRTSLRRRVDLSRSDWIKNDRRIERIEQGARRGVDWLIRLQNRDGGWPTFCRGWGRMPFDRSGSDITAHVMRGLSAWQDLEGGARDVRRITKAIARGLRFLERQQRDDGSWLPLWFGNQDWPDDENPCYGTAKVLMAYRDLGQFDTQPAKNGLRWIVQNQNTDGGWGGGASRRWEASSGLGLSSVEETALCTETLLSTEVPLAIRSARRGLGWLVRAVESGQMDQAWPIGFYFAKLWYDERLYPLIFATAALGQALAGPGWAEPDEPNGPTNGDGNQ